MHRLTCQLGCASWGMPRLASTPYVSNLCVRYCLDLLLVWSVEFVDADTIIADLCWSADGADGQGMTVGIKGAILLRDLLQKRLGPGVKFSSEQSKAVLKGFGKVMLAPIEP